MRRARHSHLVDKAIDAAISAIEIYNKPSSRYREETFAILMLNAWELLLKARILKENKNRIRSIEVWERKIGKPGAPAKRLTSKRNRAGNVMTIGVGAAVAIVRAPMGHRGPNMHRAAPKCRDHSRRKPRSAARAKHHLTEMWAAEPWREHVRCAAELFDIVNLSGRGRYGRPRLLPLP